MNASSQLEYTNGNLALSYKATPCNDKAALSMPQYWPLHSVLQSPLLECDKEKMSIVELSKQLQNVVFIVFQIAEN